MGREGGPYHVHTVVGRDSGPRFDNEYLYNIMSMNIVNF